MELEDLRVNPVGQRKEKKPTLTKAYTSPQKIKKSSTNTIKRNKAIKYEKFAVTKSKSLFGTSSTERNELSKSSVPGPGSYDDVLSTFEKQIKSPKSRTTFGVSPKKTAQEIEKSSKLGPGIYESPKHIVNGGTWSKSPRKVTKQIDMRNRDTMCEKNGMMTTPKTQIFTKGEVESETQPKSCNISNKFRPLSLSPTHNKKTVNNFGTSPRFCSKTTDTQSLSSFKGSAGASVKECIVSSSNSDIMGCNPN